MKLAELKAQVKETGAVINNDLDLRYRATWEYLYSLHIDPLYSDARPVFKGGKVVTELTVPTTEEKWRALENYLHSKVKTKSVAPQPTPDYQSFLPSEEPNQHTLHRVELREPCLTADGGIYWELEIREVLDIDIFSCSFAELEEAIEAGLRTYTPDPFASGMSDHQRFLVLASEARARLKDLRFNGYANYLEF
ncbi:hypothetical protein H6G04_33995 [Calothrix membranacea FACHB-236]|nr:hypothetical protein [Calothrix membranacea FACHB-236]